MRSIFGKLLLWVLATSLVVFVGTVLISAWNFNPWQSPFSRLMSIHERTAREAYESGGTAGLADYARRFRERTDMTPVLTDSRGRDILTGKDYSATVHRPRIPFFGSPGTGMIPYRAPDGKYFFVLLLSGARFGNWMVTPQTLYELVVIVLLCYLLAMSLTSPVRKLQKTLERFGHGDFSARANSKRRDELGQLSRTFDAMADRIQTLMAAERRLLLDISHEIRSPLARLGVLVELARNSDNVEDSLNRIQREADRLNELVGQLLQVTRAEGDPEKLHRDPVRLDELLDMIVDDSAVEAQARNCELNLTTAGAVSVSGEPELLRRALENIIRNAIRYSPPGMPVDIAARESGEKALVMIRDYGPGAPEEALERIFDPFYRVDTDRSRSAGGVGLGLSIARRAVELHGGAIRASNAAPGLLVEMELPLNAGIAVRPAGR